MSGYDQSEFLVPQLTPERIGGGQAKVYQLTADSVHPTRITGRNEYGEAIEETIPICKSREFVTRSGCVNRVPLRTAPGNANDPDSLAIEQYTVTRLIRSGFLPLAECPHTSEYRAIAGGPLVRPKAGESDCGGKPGGCEHLHKVMKLRRERAHAAWQADQDWVAHMKAEEVATQAAAIGQVLLAHQGGADLKAARQRAKDNHRDGTDSDLKAAKDTRSEG